MTLFLICCFHRSSSCRGAVCNMSDESVGEGVSGFIASICSCAYERVGNEKGGKVG